MVERCKGETDPSFMVYIKSAFVVILQYTNMQILDKCGVTAETATSVLPCIAGLQWYFCYEIIMTNTNKGSSVSQDHDPLANFGYRLYKV